MKTNLLTVFLFISFVLPLSVFSAIIHIPADYSTIQEGIDAAYDGDIVLVEPNTYYENINLNEKNIILCSNYFTTGDSTYITNTIIDGNYNGRVITINQGQNSTCQIIGFTIQHGDSNWEYGMPYGGGIFISDSSPQILHCIIQNNIAPSNGGGLGIYGSTAGAKVINCSILNNTAESYGGGVFMGDCSVDAELINCVISGNSITCNCDWNGGGGGVNLTHTGKLTNCLITGNSAPYAPAGGGAIQCDWGDYYGSQGIFVTGCTIANNTAFNFGGVSLVNGLSGGEFRNCIIYGNTDQYLNISNYDGNSLVNCCSDPLPDGIGNISSDPNFINPGSDNFRLSAGSPCIDAGDNFYNSQSVDLDGNPRIKDVIDMGAYEYGSFAVVNVQIGSGTDVSSQFPIYSCYNYNYSQQIYLWNEISSGGGATGLITKIRFYYAGGGSQFSNWNNWTVYLGNTTKAEFSTISDWVPAAALKQVFSGLISTPVDGTWLEINLPTPFYYSGDNVVIAVYENSNGYDCTAQWGSFYTGAPRGLSYYDDSYNPNPLSPPDGIINPDIAQIQFEINTAVGTLEGYVTEEPACTVPIAGATIMTGADSTTSDASGYYQLHLPIGTYYDITVFYHDVTQTISPIEITQGNTTIQDFCIQPYYAPPVNLQATISGPVLNNVHLSWMAPGSVADQYIYWGPGTLYGALGYNAPMTFSVASRWPVSDIAPYDGTYLKKIRFVPTDANAAYTLKVWKGSNASTLLLSQAVSDPIIGGWNDVTLTSPILIDGAEELWFGYEIVETVKGYPAGLGQGPAVTGKGDMINSGGGWFSVKEAWGWEFNWTLQGFVSENALLAPQHLIPMEQSELQQPVVANPMAASLKPQVMLLEQTTAVKNHTNHAMANEVLPKPATIAPSAPSVVMTGYKVYRNYSKIADNIPDLSFDDLALSKGVYEYQVSAQYENGESVLIGPVFVNIYTCFPPTSLTVSNSTLTTTTADLSWTPSTISTNLVWILEWGPTGFWQGYGTTDTIYTTPQYSLDSLTPGTEYDFYLKTYCSSTDESQWVKKTFRTHYFDCPPGATTEPETCGSAVNDGCEMAEPATGTISCGETICGTSWLHRSHRDSDWYSFTLTDSNDVTLSGNAEFTSFFGIARSPCDTSLFYSSATYSPGYNTPITIRLGAGTYYAYAAPAYSEQVFCDSLSRYWIKLICNPCLSVTTLNALNITSSSADLSWTSTIGTWNIEWGITGFAKGTGTMITGTHLNPYTLSGLTAGYSYSFYVQSDCGSGALSNWTGPYEFYVPCSTATLPYSQDFTSQLVGITPQCWQEQGDGQPTNWTVDNTNNAGGDLHELTFNRYNPYFSGRSYITSPVINTTGQASLDLSFKQYIHAYSSGTFCEIWTTSDGGSTWHSVWSIAQNSIFGPQTTYLSITTSDVGSANFQFAFAVNGYSWDLDIWNIDDISLTGVPQTGTLQGIVNVCPGGGALQGVSVAAGALTTTTNASGFYQFLNIPVATYSVQFSLTGYVTKSVSGVAVQNGMTTTLDTCLTLSGPPTTLTVQNDTVFTGQTNCFNATQTITVAGGGTTFVVQSGGIANMIAGHNILYYPGTKVNYSGSLHGHIAPGGPWCGLKDATIVASALGETESLPVGEKSFFTIYPNPTSGEFSLQLTGIDASAELQMEIYGMQGDRIQHEALKGQQTYHLSLAGKPLGIYFIRVVSGNRAGTGKIIMQ
ncbi:MAG: carboxypeptidase regulatory-like domain-containing protein [Bacteroidetes bacterium]|nr:carboxypeptidase regulatory-like domain-containing protein [Bacteroidota bacterium]